MLAIDWSKIDKFYVVFAAVMVVMSVVVIVTFKTVFSSIISGTETGDVDVAKELQVNKKQLDNVYEFVLNKEDISLDAASGVPINDEDQGGENEQE